VLSLRNDVVQAIEQEIAYDDGSSVQDRLNVLKQKVSDCRAQVYLSADEEETLRLWSEALSPRAQQEGGE
jgi:regulator of replication initiation timing